MTTAHNVAQFDATAINHAVAEFGPAKVVATGATAVARRIHVVQNGSEATKMFAVTMKGKVGVEARGGLRENAMASCAISASNGNYKPLAEMLSTLTGESTFITGRASYESLEDRFESKRDDLVAQGKYYKKGDDSKLSARAAVVEDCLFLIVAVKQGVAAIFAQKQAQDAGSAE